MWVKEKVIPKLLCKLNEPYTKLSVAFFFYYEYMKNYCKFSKNSLFLFLNKMLVIRAGIRKMLVRIAYREDPDQTASSEAGWSGSWLFV